MKAKIVLLGLLIGCFCTTAFAQSHSVSKAEALSIAQRQFQGKDVDYFILQDNSPKEWTIFVDAEPMKGWEHECYTLTIPKTITTTVNVAIPSSKLQRKLPPSGDFVPLSVQNRYGTNANSAPSVAKVSQSNQTQTVAQRTYAIILSGGVNKLSNYERYWNDCSFVYQTLVNKYGVPKENVYPIMADGNDPAADMRLTTGGFKSQPLDLDNDGVAEIKLAATKANIQATLNALSAKLGEDDHLIFYVIDHGGTTDNNTNSYICLWGNESLYDYQLAEMLTPFTQKYVNVNVVLGQCFSGGFNDNLTKVGCVVASASTGSESSWACSDIPYDEFVYQWTSSINGANHLGSKIDADTDKNGRITMEEAFAYAKANDRRSAEHPQYVSTPLSVGEDLAFNHLAPAVDLYIKDNPEDTGKEPNLTTDEFWKSPSICVRNEEDGIFEHQNPEYSSDHQMAFVYVRVYNRGKKKFNGEGKWVHVYWAQASTGLTTKAWKGREVYENKYATGGTTEAAPIPSINPGEYADVSIGWTLPQLLKNYPEGNFHFCLLAKLMDTPYDDGYVDGRTYFDLRGSNDQAQKNVTIIRKKDLSKGFNVYVRNIESSAKAYTLELIPHTATDATLYSKAKVEMEMSTKVYSAWERGGFISQDIEIPEKNSNEASLRTVRFVSPQSKLQRIYLEGNEFDIVKLKFDFSTFSLNSTTYTFDLVQKDENGNIIGGETFVVESPTRSFTPIEITKDPIGTGQFKLGVDNTGFHEIKWLNGHGETIGDGETVVVIPTACGNRYSVVAMTENGDVATDEISLENENRIESVSMARTDCIKVALYANAPANSMISVTSLQDGTTQVSRNVPEGSKNVCLEFGNLSKGMYIVCYYINSEIVDQVKINL